MFEKVKALLVHHHSETLLALKAALERLGMSITQAESRAHAKRLLSGLNPAPLVFTDTQLPDGTWADVLALASKAAKPVNAIVVARVVNTRFYVEAIEAGAFDFLAPPFNSTDLAYVVRTAVDNAVARRSARSTPLPSPPEGLLAEVSEADASISSV